jgi:hypothetical protein
MLSRQKASFICNGFATTLVSARNSIPWRLLATFYGHRVTINRSAYLP